MTLSEKLVGGLEEIYKTSLDFLNYQSDYESAMCF